MTLLGDEEQAARVIVRATYIPDSELSGGGPAAGQSGDTAIGQAAALDTLELTVRDVRPQVLAQTPSGHVYLAIDYEVVNVGEGLPLLTSSFLHRLEGPGGLTYPLAPVATGSAASLPATVNAGERVSATALYVVPESALGETLSWSFASSASGPGVRVSVPPYRGALSPLVSVDEARLQGGNLAVTFTVQAALHDVQITANDILAEGAALDPIAGMFPWQVEAGRSGQFTLLVSPQANPVRLGMLEQGFEVSY